MFLNKVFIIFILLKTTTAAQTEQNDNNNNFCSKQVTRLSREGHFYNITIMDCCEGYIRMSDKICVPVCSDCIYGSCKAPNVCDCYEGYIKYENQCTPVCKFNCTNGYCSEPGKCSCRQGYEFDVNNSTHCLPICEEKCPKFSICSEPNKCECESGYVKNKLTKQCEPVCEDLPKNGKCLTPNVWDCFEKFRPDFNINKCILNSCKCHYPTGYCLDNEEQCECYKGFRKNPTTGQCESFCEAECKKSTCVANQCECWEGYHKTSEDNICEQHSMCNNKPCLNGECLATGECKCKTGFIKSLTYNGHVQCDPVSTFVGKLMSLILGVPLVLASCVLLIVFIIARKRSFYIEEQPDRELQLLSEMH